MRRASETAWAMSSAGGSNAELHERLRVRREVLHDDFLDVGELKVQIPNREQRLDALPAVPPMPMRMPVVNGMRSSPASRSMRRRTDGRLSGAR